MCFRKRKKAAPVEEPKAEEPKVEETKPTSEAATVVNKAPTLSEEIQEDKKRISEIEEQAEKPAKSIDEQQKEMFVDASLAKVQAEKDLEKERQKQLETERQRKANEAQIAERQRRQEIRQKERERSLLKTMSDEPSDAAKRRRTRRAGRGRRSLLSSVAGGMGFYSRFT
tara:strand:- start:4451 stop:4960 length:510 start_codon:yes stop_codon:yes gene_type:complete